MPRLLAFALLLVLGAGLARAGHDARAEWSWHVVSAGSDESRVAIYRRDTPLGIYNFSCDLTGAVSGPVQESGATINLIRPPARPGGLLIITCDVGAHSQMLAIVDLASPATRPALTRSGSYFVGWELQEGELWISFDQPCDTGPTVECPDGFETLFEKFPPQ